MSRLRTAAFGLQDLQALPDSHPDPGRPVDLGHRPDLSVSEREHARARNGQMVGRADRRRRVLERALVQPRAGEPLVVVRRRSLSRPVNLTSVEILVSYNFHRAAGTSSSTPSTRMTGRPTGATPGRSRSASTWARCGASASGRSARSSASTSSSSVPRAPRTGSSGPRSSFRSRRASRVFEAHAARGTPDQGLMALGSADCQDPGMRDDQDRLTRR